MQGCLAGHVQVYRAQIWMIVTTAEVVWPRKEDEITTKKGE